MNTSIHLTASPFLDYLASSLSLYELTTIASPPTDIPEYQGSSDARMDQILRSLDGLTKRMYTAEAELQRLHNETMDPSFINHEKETAEQDEPRSSPNNNMALMTAVTQMARSIIQGDLTPRINLDVEGEVANELKANMNELTGSLETTAVKISRVVSEVGTRGYLGGQVSLDGNLGGTWKSVVENVNALALQHTISIRSAVGVTNAIMRGDLTMRFDIDCQGELLMFKETINAMEDRLAILVAEVIKVASEVGTEGKLGVQVASSEFSGIWKELVDNVNVLATGLSNRAETIQVTSTTLAQLLNQVLEPATVFKLRAA